MLADTAMSDYTVRDIERLLGLSKSVVQGFVDAGFVAPQIGERNEMEFSFQDLILLKTAQGLAAARIPPRRLKQALARLRAELPPSLPLSGVRISAVDGRIVVQQGSSQWHADSGQYLLAFSTPEAAGVAQPLPSEPQPGEEPLQELQRARELEAFDPDGAERVYRAAIARDPDLLAAAVNLGCLLQARRQVAAAEQVYREALDRFPDEALLHFNLATALEDGKRFDEAVSAYERALAIDPAFADAHYNLARIHEAAARPQAAIRHLGEYRRLIRR
jgi:tetratricopeptide (TPR) repeat protein